MELTGAHPTGGPGCEVDMEDGQPSNYRPRLVDAQIERQLQLFGAVLIKGPKWCGKTTTAEAHSRSAIFLQDPDHSKEYRSIASMKVSLLLEGDNPRLIDEWQTIPSIWNAVRFSVDRKGETGLYILTGSSLHTGMRLEGTDDPGSQMHSGAGRVRTVSMRTMSLWESGESDGSVRMADLFDGKTIEPSSSGHDFEDIARMIVRGGWPSCVVNDIQTGEVAEGYCEAILESEVYIDGRKRSRTKMESLLRSLSRNVATAASNTTILCDITPDDEIPPGGEDDEDAWRAYDIEEGGPPMCIDTLRSYIDALRDISVVEDMSAWTPQLRSKAVIRTAETRYLTDPSIAAYFLKASPRDLLLDPETFGLLFETMAVRDLRVYAQAVGGEVFHYRDKNGLEVDAVVHLRDGRWGAFEIKLSQDKVEDGARALNRLKEKVDSEYRSRMAFLAVLTATGFAYTRPDGVHVIPIGCLRDRGPDQQSCFPSSSFFM